MQTKVDELDVLCQQKIQEMENAPAKAKKKFWQALSKAHHNLDNIRLQLQRHMKNFENPSEKIINAINKKLKKAEDSLQKLYSEIERIKSNVIKAI